MLKLQNRVLSKSEITTVIAYHKSWRRRKLLGTGRNFAIFRLSACCALRRKEIAGLNLSDFFFESDRPFIRVRKEITKGHRKAGATEVTRKARKVSLLIDTETREDLKKWWTIRMEQTGGDRNAPFICGTRPANFGKRLPPTNIAKMWRTALYPLGSDRARTTGIHSGRHTCLSHLVRNGFPLAFVRDFAGHANIATTSIYSHSFDEESLPKDVFGGAA